MKSINDIKFQMPVVALNDLLDLIIKQQTEIIRLQAIVDEDVILKQQKEIIKLRTNPLSPLVKPKEKSLNDIREHVGLSRIEDDKSPLVINDDLDNLTVYNFKTREEATKVLSTLITEISKNNKVSIHLLYSLIDANSGFLRDRNRGWYNLANAVIDRNSYGYKLKLPNVVSFDIDYQARLDSLKFTTAKTFGVDIDDSTAKHDDRLASFYEPFRYGKTEEED